MRQIHVAGEKLFVDWAGDTIPVFDAATGEEHRAHIFVAALGASNYTYAERLYPGGTENNIIFPTVRGSMPKRRPASRRLSPSICTA